ncbi:MAG: hypothetical protein AAF515_12535 [Pseudomonadota bacterium]
MLELSDRDVWLIIGAMTLGVTLGIAWLTRSWRWWWPKTLLRTLTPVICLTPAMVPAAPGHFAPAYLIVFFEAVLQRDGQPESAIGRLAAVSLAVVVVVTLAAIYRAAQARRTPHEPPEPTAEAGA